MSDSTLYLYTSLTAGSSHIVTATARLETILKANKIPFRAIDVATDEQARKLWGRRAKGRKLPGLVKYNQVVGDLEEIEEWNEYGELRMQVNSVEDLDDFSTTTANPASQTTPAASTTTTETPAPPKTSTIQIQTPPGKPKEAKKDDHITLALRQAGQEAASKAKENTQAKVDPKNDKAVNISIPEAAKTVPDTEQTPVEQPARRRSIVPAAEIAEITPQRPPLIPEVAAVSSANFRADNAEALGLVEHHRGSIISATSKEEMDQVTRDIRKSISGGPQEVIDSLRDKAEQQEQEESIEEEPAEESKESSKKKDETKGNDEKDDLPQNQDPKAEDKASVSVQD